VNKDFRSTLQVIRLTQMYWTAFEIHCARSPLTEAVESGMAASRMMTAMRGGGVIQVSRIKSNATTIRPAAG